MAYKIYEISSVPNRYRMRYKISSPNKKNARQDCKLTDEELEKWLLKDSWSLGEAAFLICEISPPPKNAVKRGGVTWKRVCNFDSFLNKINATELSEAKDYIQRAKEIGDLTDPARPNDLIPWVRAKFPLARICVLQEAKQVAPETLPRGTRPETDSHRQSSENRTIGTVQKILISLALKHYEYRHDNPNKAAKAIHALTCDKGVHVGYDTIAKHLIKAWEDNSQEILNKKILDKSKY